MRQRGFFRFRLTGLMRSTWPVILLLALSLPAGGARGEPMVLYAATDSQVVAPLIADFEALHPDIRVIYHDLNSGELYDRFLREVGTAQQPDVLWSSAMNLQFKLVNDGYAAPYKSPEASALPAWAIWKGEAFGVTFEPIVFAYNKKLLAQEEVPKTHAELVRFLKERSPQRSRRVASYDPRGSGLGYLLHTQDMEANPVAFWNLIRVFGSNQVILEPSTAEMLAHLASGRAALGYNVLLSYAMNRAVTDPDIGVVLPSDYTLVLSRIAFINRQAPHPQAARKWIDYLLSKRGQSQINRVGLFAVREDVPSGDRSIVGFRREMGPALRPIVISTGLLTYLDRMKRELFLSRWDTALAPPR